MPYNAFRRRGAIMVIDVEREIRVYAEENDIPLNDAEFGEAYKSVSFYLLSMLPACLNDAVTAVKDD